VQAEMADLPYNPVSYTRVISPRAKRSCWYVKTAMCVLISGVTIRPRETELFLAC